MFGSILVPLDGSAFAEHALPFAMSLARRNGVHLRLVHALEPPLLPYPPEVRGDPAATEEVAYTRVARYLERLARRLDDELTETVGYDIVCGPIEASVREVARCHAADLVVMTTHGRGGLARAWLGSVADRVLRDGGVPVLLIRPREGEVDAPRGGRIGRVLVPLDGSPEAEQVLPAARALAGPGGRLILLAVSDAPRAVAVPVPHGALNDGSWPPCEAARYLNEVVSRTGASDTRVVTSEAPARAILESAAEAGADAIALATHGRGGIGRMILGSTADKVIRTATMPVLAARRVVD